uniref:Uncharacterized protein n=1 Tax=Steinernema glaseri TaxID=37863 RepID=A0A1I8AFK2_9BILA
MSALSRSTVYEFKQLMFSPEVIALARIGQFPICSIHPRPSPCEKLHRVIEVQYGSNNRCPGDGALTAHKLCGSSGYALLWLVSEKRRRRRRRQGGRKTCKAKTFQQLQLTYRERTFPENALDSSGSWTPISRTAPVFAMDASFAFGQRARVDNAHRISRSPPRSATRCGTGARSEVPNLLAVRVRRRFKVFRCPGNLSLSASAVHTTDKFGSPNRVSEFGKPNCAASDRKWKIDEDTPKNSKHLAGLRTRFASHLTTYAPFQFQLTTF